ncbi:MAG: hypothetical protein JW969_15100 [Spirochaetales bacterium]|nr:hypothetical protein [Spirochaetales bacterium]
MSSTRFDSKDRYTTENFNRIKPFASFLPGIAGPMGIPLWVYYVNRGQGIASFGIRDKDHPIMEFTPAVKSYQIVPYVGFRTFLRIKEGNDYSFCEPFKKTVDDGSHSTRMYTGFNEFEIEDLNSNTGLKVNVLYFTIPSDNYAGLVRKVTLKNISKKQISGEILDGLPVVVPYGILNYQLKDMCNLTMAWLEVKNLENDIPYYKITSSTQDTTEIEQIDEGNFYLCFKTDSSNQSSIIKPIVDSDNIFGYDTSYTNPEIFQQKGLKQIYDTRQISQGKYPCGFFGTNFSIAPGEELTLTSLIGHTTHVAKLNERKNEMANPVYIENKYNESARIANDIVNNIETRSGSKIFDLYCKQTFLDNVTRGGLPTLLDREGEPFVFYLYSRKHGDLERDYNYFVLLPEYYSQGNGNYRDVNQNRRSDVFFKPEINDDGIVTFLNLIQTDGYNPLVVKGLSFKLKPEYLEETLKLVSDKERMKAFFSRSFTPGSLIKYLDDHDISLSDDLNHFTKLVYSHSILNHEADNEDDYWIDHWTYNMDLIDVYSSVYPDKMEELLFSTNEFSFYEDTAYIQPRSLKYVELKGKARQSNAVFRDPEKKKMIESRKEHPTWMRTQKGKGEIYRTNLISKLLCLYVNKFSSLDSHGMGIEMEAGKPGWNDAMNGLPGLFSSSMSETYEVKRLIQLLLDNCGKFKGITFSLSGEIDDFLKQIDIELDEFRKSKDSYQYWDKITSAREKYREDTRFGFTGEEVKRSTDSLVPLLEKSRTKIDEGIQKALTLGGDIPLTFIKFKPVKWEIRKDKNGTPIKNQKGQTTVSVSEFKPEPLPHFLEGIVKAIKTADSVDEARKLSSKAKNSKLYDKKLKLYKLNESLLNQPFDIGRGRAFTPGWLENESVWLHMEYKYLIELLKTGLYDEFWEEAKNCFVPFMKPEVYGRSILENSSFIVSSAYPDESLHGRGFFARLSGASAEFVQMWIIMMAGRKPFTLSDNGKLILEFKPTLPGWLFSEKNELGFNFLGSTWVNYHNPGNKNAFPGTVLTEKIVISYENGEQTEINGAIIEEPHSRKIRSKQAKRIDIYFK